jgi:hypothetical protein
MELLLRVLIRCFVGYREEDGIFETERTFGDERSKMVFGQTCFFVVQLLNWL